MAAAALATGACELGTKGLLPEAPTVTLSPHVSTVATVTWSTEDPTTGYIEYGLDPDNLDQRTPMSTSAATEHDQLLLGLAASTTYHYRVISVDADNGEDTVAGETESFETGFLPVGLPPITTTVPPGAGGHDAYTIVPVISDQASLLILDAQGQIVWYHAVDNLLDTYRGRLSVDGQSILYNAGSVSGDPAENSEMVRVGLDGTVLQRMPVPLLAHDFVEHPDGTIGAMAVEYRMVGDRNVRGDKIVEVDANGVVTPVFSTWNCYDPNVDIGSDQEHGWTFANALDFDPVENVYYLGMRNFSSIAKIDRVTGQCIWTLGLTSSDFQFADNAPPFKHQHQFEIRGNELMVFDNEGAFGRNSRVTKYSLDFAQMVVNHEWSYMSDPSVYTFVLGEPTTLQNGDIFVNWSAAGRMERINAEQQMQWRVEIPAGQIFGFNTVVDSLYPSPSAAR